VQRLEAVLHGRGEGAGVEEERLGGQGGGEEEEGWHRHAVGWYHARMWIGWLIASALGATLEVDVVVEERPAAAVPVARPERPSIPVGRGAVQVDGRLDEIVWIDGLLAPPLDPWLDGGTPPPIRAVVARTLDGLGLAAWRIPPGLDVRWVVDPDGTGTRWWRVELGNAIRTQVCSLAGRDLPADTLLPQRAVPCEHKVEAKVGGGGDAWEVVLPDSAIGRLTSAARILLSVGKPGGEGGAWAPYGRVEPLPQLGRPLALGGAPGRVRVAIDEEGWTVRLDLRDDSPLGVWEFRRYVLGEVVDIHRQTIAERGTTSVRLDPVEGALVVLEASATAPDGIARSVVRTVQNVPPRAWLLSPVVDTEVEVGWSTPRAMDTVVRLQTLGGRVLAEAEVSLPAGGGRLRFAAPRPRYTAVVVEGLLPATPLVTSRSPRRE
jgi:hypothetical protein